MRNKWKEKLKNIQKEKGKSLKQRKMPNEEIILILIKTDLRISFLKEY